MSRDRIVPIAKVSASSTGCKVITDWKLIGPCCLGAGVACKFGRFIRAYEDGNSESKYVGNCDHS